MKKKQVQILRYAATFVACAALGVGGSYAMDRMAQPVSAPVDETAAVQTVADTVEVRVRGGVAEWFDGVRWNAAGDVAQLKRDDPTAVTSGDWQTLAQQRAAAEAQRRQSALTLLSREENTLSVGEKPVVRQQTRRPSSTTPTTPSGGGTPAPPPTPTPTPTPTPDPTPSGDGEDMVWGG